MHPPNDMHCQITDGFDQDDYERYYFPSYDDDDDGETDRQRRADEESLTDVLLDIARTRIG